MATWDGGMDEGYDSPQGQKHFETRSLTKRYTTLENTGHYGAIDEEDNMEKASEVSRASWLKKCFPDWFCDEFRKIASLSWSMFLLAVFSYLIGPVSLAFCGHLGTRTMDGVALALTVINVTGISIAMGLAMACGTFFSQCYGSVNKGRVSLYLIRSLIIILLFILPCWAIHLNTEIILLRFHQEAELAKIAGEYIAYFMPALPAVFIMEILMQYLRCQNIIFPTIIIGGAGVVVNAVMHGLLLFAARMGSNGSALAQVVAFNFMSLSLIGYILYTGLYKDTWGGWKLRDVFEDWGVFLKLAVSGMLMLGMEWWTFEIGTLVAGILGPVALGAQSIGFQLLSIVYMVPLGISLASTIRVGQLLGAEDYKQVVRAIKATFSLAVICELVVGLFLVALHRVLPKIFTFNSAIVDYAGSIVLMVAFYEVFDSVACVSAGILRGCGRQVSGAVVTFIGFYIIALPIGMTLMFGTTLELIGYYSGLVLGMSVVVSIFCFLIWFIDWEREVERARVRTGTDGIAMEVMGSAPDLVHQGTEPFISRPANRCRSCSISNDWYEDYIANYSSQQDLVYDPNEETTPKTFDWKTAKLAISRVIFVLFMVMTFVVGVVLRITLEVPGKIHSNSTNIVFSNLTNATGLTFSSTIGPYGASNFTTTSYMSTSARHFTAHWG